MERFKKMKLAILMVFASLAGMFLVGVLSVSAATNLWLGQSSGNIKSCDSTGNCVDLGDKGSEIWSLAIFEDKLWLGHVDGFLQSCDSSGNCTNYGDKGNDIRSMTVFNNKLWLGFVDGHLQSCDSSGNCVDHGDKGSSIMAMADFDGELWLGQWDGHLQSCDSSGNCVDHGDKGDYIWSTAVFDGELWLGRRWDNYLQSCDSSGNCVDHGDKGSFIMAMADFDGELWLGQWDGHLQSCDSSGNCVDHGDKGDKIWSTAVFDGKLWLGGSGAGSWGFLQSCDSSGNCINHGDKGTGTNSMAVGFVADTTPPTLTTEALDKNGVSIVDGGTVNLDNTDTITIRSNASDPAPSSGIQDHKIRWWKNGILQSTDTWATGGTHSITITGPLNDGDVIEYSSEATDNGGPNTSCDPEDLATCGVDPYPVRHSFTVEKTKTWAKAFGGSGADIAWWSFQQTFDKGYIAAGYTSSYGAGGNDFLILKVDSSGNQEWAKTFGGGNMEWARSLQQTDDDNDGDQDDGYIIAGLTGSYGGMFPGDFEFMVLKIDSSGNQEWAKTFGDGAINSLWDYAHSVQQTSDGGYIVAGLSMFFSRTLIIKLDSLGNQQWAKAISTDGGDFDYLVQQTSDGGYIVVSILSGNVLALKLDSSGVQEWAKTFDGGGWEYVFSVQQTVDDGYVIGGRTDSAAGAGNYDFLVLKIDSSGVQQWAKTFGGADNDWVWSIQQTSDGGYIMAGETQSYGTGSSSPLIIRLDSSGVQQWARTFGGNIGDGAFSVQQTSDGGYAIGGYTTSFGAGSSDFLILKLDQNGNMEDCTPPLDDPGIITTSDIAPITSDVAPVISDVTPSTSDVTPTTTSPILTETDVCAGCGTPPTCSISTPATAEINVAFDIDVSGSVDPDGDINNAKVRFSIDNVKDDNQTGTWTKWFSWNADDSDGSWTWNAATKKASYTFTAVGDKEIWMEIEDEDGLTCQNNSDMDATAGNANPIASITCNPASCEGYSLNPTSLDNGGLELQNTSTDLEDCAGGFPCLLEAGFSGCAWDVGGNASANCSDRTIAWIDALNFPIGNPTADLTVTDQDGASHSAPQKSLTFKKDIFADFRCSLDGGVTWQDCTAINPNAGDTVDFRAVNGNVWSTPSDSAALTNFDWDFGDGGAVDGNGMTVNLTIKYPAGYPAAGNYLTVLTITDSDGRHAERSYNINVGAAPDIVDPTIDYLEAEDSAGNLISDGPDGISGNADDGEVYDSMTGNINIDSLASDNSGVIANHQIHFTKDNWVTTSIKDCGANANCSIDICSEATNHPVYACPLPVGTTVKYKSQATDSAAVPNTGYSVEKSFDVVAGPASPICSIFTPASEEVGTAFDIDVSGSSDDGNIVEVRFLVDNNQNNNPTGAWTGWFNWIVNDAVNGWDATAKTKEWIFALPVGDKEVWVELKDNDGLTSQCHSDMTATGANNSPTVTGFFTSMNPPCELGPTPQATFGWTYNDPDGDPQNDFRIQIADDAGFANIIHDETRNNDNSNSFTTPSGLLEYNKTYWYRVDVWDDKGAKSTPDWSGLSYQFDGLSGILHQYPTAKFSYSAPNDPPEQFDIVTFDPLTAPDNSVCYDDLGVVDCSTFDWDFDGNGVIDDTTSPPPADPKAVHSYGTEGTFEVDMKVTDPDGNSCWASDFMTAENRTVTIGEGMPEWNETTP